MPELTTNDLLREKRELTHRLVDSDLRWHKLIRVVIRPHTKLRAGLYLIDEGLERRGIILGHTVMPGVSYEPGLNAGYRRGRIVARMIVLHFTVGTSSGSLIKNRGLAQFLVDRDGTIHEYAPADAVCAGACEWNIYAIHIEVEAENRGQWTKEQIASVARILGWGGPTYGIRLDVWRLGPEYDETARMPVGFAYYGISNHDALHEKACAEHTDGATPEEASQVRALIGAGPAPAPTLTEDNEMGNCIYAEGHPHIFSIISSTEVQERWGYPGKPSFFTHKLSDTYPLKKAGKVSCGRDPHNPDLYTVALERDDGSERCFHRIKALDGTLTWVYE